MALVHGFGLDHRVWEPQMPALRQRSRVLRHDERGFGSSTTPTARPYSHADDWAALLGHLNLQNAHLVGLSVGAMHALELALTQPSLVRSLVLVDPSGLAEVPFPPAITERFARIRKVISTEGVAAAKRIWRAGGWFVPALENPTAMQLLDAQLAAYSGWHWQNDNPARTPSPPIHQRLGELRVPTLVIVGERDLDYNQRVAKLLSERIPGAQLCTLPGVGHFPNVEAPELFNATLQAFLDRVEAG